MELRYAYATFELLSELVRFLQQHKIERGDIVAIIPVYRSKKIGLVYQEMSYD